MKIGIIGAMDEELIPIRAILSNLEKLEKVNALSGTARITAIRSSSPAATQARSMR